MNHLSDLPRTLRWRMLVLAVLLIQPGLGMAQEPVAADKSAVSQNQSSGEPHQSQFRDPAAWLDEFGSDSREQYTITGDVQWKAGQFTLGPGATIGREIEVGNAWEVRLDLMFPPPKADAKPAMSRFEFTLAGEPLPYAVVWKTEHHGGMLRTRLQFVVVTPRPTGMAGLFFGETVEILREADWPHNPSGQWSLSWNSGLLQVQHGAQPVFVSYAESSADFSAWALRSSGASLAVTQLNMHGVARQAFSAEASAQLTEAKKDNQVCLRLLQEGKFEDAAILGERVLEIRRAMLGEEHSVTAFSLNNLAEAYREQGNYAAAETLYKRALKILEKAIGQDHPVTANSLSNLAMLYASQANYAAAEPLYQRALTIMEKALGQDHPNTATVLSNLAMLYASQANYSAAEPLLKRALAIMEKALGADHPETAGHRMLLAHCLWKRDHVETAAPLAELALRSMLLHLDATAAIQSEEQQFLMSRDVGNYMSIWLNVSCTGAKWTSTAYRDVLTWKGLITARQQGLRLALKDDALFAEFRKVTQQLSSIAMNPPSPPSDQIILPAWKAAEPELRRTWESQKATLEAEHEQLEKELAVKSVEFRGSLQNRSLQVEDLAATLQEQDRPTAIIDLLEYSFISQYDHKRERHIVAFVVRGDQPVVRVELGSADKIASRVDQWRKSFGGKVADQDPGADLRQCVWLPLEPHLQGIETILISPDGPLALVPWGALPGEKPGTYLVEERAIAVIPVPQLLPSLVRKPLHSGVPESLLLAGDIEYGGDPGEPQHLLSKRDAVGRLRNGNVRQFRQLDAAQGELTSIKDSYQNAQDTGTVMEMSKLNATEAVFREHAPQHQWLHIITHGYFAPEAFHSALRPTDVDVEKLLQYDQPQAVRGENPGLLSGLAFAGANRPPEPDKDDGILTALEVEVLDLHRVDAVVLSACETGLGSVAGGEGLLGLQRAFQVAGAKTVVASLWKVPDAATSRLMQRFYENLWDKQMPRLDALREAQIWMLKEGSRATDGAGVRGIELLESQPPIDNRLPPFY